MRLDVSHEFLPKTNSVRASQVMDHFGIGFEQGRYQIADGLELPCRPGDIVLFTGPSGSGKSSLMRATAAQLAADGPENSQPLVNIDALDLSSRLLIDSLDRPAEEAMHLLSSCGLGEARVMLRQPQELSDGQRYRFRLALALAQNPRWVIADEYSATLDRTLARVISHNLRRVASRTGTGFLLATTHDDVATDLDPDLHVQCQLNGQVEFRFRDPARQSSANGTEPPTENRKKKASASPTTCGSAVRPNAIGRTSLGGITAATISRSSGS